MVYRSPAFALAALLALSLTVRSAAGAPAAPPGFNVHLLHATQRHQFWRGGAPTRATLKALAAAARRRGSRVTLVDLRRPANRDDRSGKGGRLSPAAEAAAARALSLRYVSLSALDRDLPRRLAAVLEGSDLYLHCMYGVNRTGFASARYADAQGVPVATLGLARKDWQQGLAFQRRLTPRPGRMLAAPRVNESPAPRR